MKKTILGLLALILLTLPAFGIASEITIWDNQASGSGWWNKTTEDQEVEPGAATTPGWDLEGMFFEDNKLSIVGEFNFVKGKDGLGSGDIFISTNGPVIYGSDVPSPGNGDYTNIFGYNYVFDVDWGSYADGMGAYTIWQINEETLVTKASLHGGNPVSYIGSPNDVKVKTGTFYFNKTNDVDFKGGQHYTVSNFDLGLIEDFDGSFIAHFTQECGNDVIMGQVPEPATMLLLGMGLLGIGAVGRRLPLKGV